MTSHVAMLVPLLSRKAGGLFWSVSGFSTVVGSLGADVHVLGGYDDLFSCDHQQWNSNSVSSFVIRGPKGFGYQLGLFSTLSSLPINLVHTHGLWMYSSVVANYWSKKSGSPYIVSPHGMLDSWALKNSFLKKKIAGAVFEDRHLRDAACIHALCDDEAVAIREYGLNNPIAIVPNGVDIPCLSEENGHPTWYSRIPNECKVLLFLGRIHPKKGLFNLLHSWSLVNSCDRSKATEWNLVIAGWDEGNHQLELEELCNNLGINNSVHFVGPQLEVQKSLSFLSADAFVLPSFSEGLPMAVLEAWSYKLPVLMTDQCNLPGGFKENAAIRVEPTVESVVDGLRKLFTLDDESRNLMGLRGRDLVIKKYSWDVVGEKMSSVYRWVLGSSGKPSCVKSE